MDYFKIQTAAKAAFSVEYPAEYLARLEANKGNRDIAELLWFAFANGYATGLDKAAMVCDQIAASKVKTGVLQLTAQQCAAAIREG